MKLSIERSALLRSLGYVQSVVERRTTIPILSNVRLVAEADQLLPTATDMDLSLVSREAADIGVAGTTTVSAHTLYDRLRRLPDGSEIALEQNGAAPSSPFVPAAPPSSCRRFPPTSSRRWARSIWASASRFRLPISRKLIDKTRFAISSEETRYYLNGIHLHATRGGACALLRGVATDGHRLARVEVPCRQGPRGSRRSSSRGRPWTRCVGSWTAIMARSGSASRRPASASRSAPRCWSPG